MISSTEKKEILLKLSQTWPAFDALLAELDRTRVLWLFGQDAELRVDRREFLAQQLLDCVRHCALRAGGA